MDKKNNVHVRKDLDNLPQNPAFCMIAPAADDLWSDDGDIASSGMS